MTMKNQNEDRIYQSWINNANSLSKDMHTYQNWFNGCNSVRHGYSKGIIDFYSRILTADMYEYLGDPREKVSLEIGYGGGRLLYAASRIFKKSLGIDILDEKSIGMTKKILDEYDVTNYELYSYNNMGHIESESIDFIYSFIVFQHFSSIQYFFQYLDIIYDKLKKGGCANIFFGRNDINNQNYVEMPEEQFRDRGCSLFLKPDFAINELSKNFKVLEAGVTKKQPWSTDGELSGQFFVKFRKEEQRYGRA